MATLLSQMSLNKQEATVLFQLSVGLLNVDVSCFCK